MKFTHLNTHVHEGYTHFKSLKGGGVSFGAPCHGYALNCYFVHIAIQGTRSLLMKKQNVFVYLYADRERSGSVVECLA